MPLLIRSLFVAVGLCVIAVLFIFQKSEPTAPIESAVSQTAAVAPAAPVVASSTDVAPPPVKIVRTARPAPAPDVTPVTIPPLMATSAPETGKAVRIQSPYATAPESFLTVNDWTHAALVNILCTPNTDGMQSMSGSGVFIDPRGVILTNAHVAQYVLLSQSSETNLTCVVRSGSPARTAWSAEVLFIPPIWVEEHASDLVNASPKVTGEHDYALLRLTGALDTAFATSPGLHSSLEVDMREGIGFLGDPILVAGYPAEFLGQAAARRGLYPDTSTTNIKDLLTFKADTVDMMSLGGIAEAQSGSSGGPVVNAWGRLIGLITTTSEGATTADRDLRALTLSYINRDIQVQSGADLSTILSADPASQAAAFRTVASPRLLQLLIDQLTKLGR